MTRLADLALEHLRRLDEIAMSGSAAVARMWSGANPADLERSWADRAPQMVAQVTAAQVEAAHQATPYVQQAAPESSASRIIPEAFGGATREGREVGPELYGGVAHTKRLIGAGHAVGQAFQAGAAVMAILAANTIRDAGRAADGVQSVANGALYSIRVVQPGACSRCAILAGVKGYRTNFERHPGCRCTSMPLREGEAPEGFYASPFDYFDSMTEAEQDRVFTKSGAWAIRNGADPAKVVNARRGAYKTSFKRPDGTYSRARLRPTTIGYRADGSPLQVYATVEGRTARGSWGRRQNLDVRYADERYSRTSTLRLMPESIYSMSSNASPDRVQELLRRYGYLT